MWQSPPYPPSETESNPSYENPGPESLESDADDAASGYIIVIPEGQAPVTNQSGTSTPSSAQDDQNDPDYVNIEREILTDYLNVDPMNSQRPISATTVTTDSDSDDDETGPYVNQ